MTFIALALFLQSASGQMAPPLIIRPPDDSAVSKPLRAMGDSLELAGHCSRLIAPADMDKLMLVAKSVPADEPYLMSRVGKGAQHPESDAWCAARLK
ncbi:MAG: hypothetical protein V4595_13790 [Pseudomonadota bacterium]